MNIQKSIPSESGSPELIALDARLQEIISRQEAGELSESDAKAETEKAFETHRRNVESSFVQEFQKNNQRRPAKELVKHITMIPLGLAVVVLYLILR